jgi:glycosyltransferase involved in cell wall biosynthesis
MPPPPTGLPRRDHVPVHEAGTKVAVVLPALDEASTVGSVVAGIPRRIPGVDAVEVIVVDDGSKDETGERAAAAGADQIIRHPCRRGLVATFNRGVSEALAGGADVVVHLDSDGQHDPAYIPQLIAPILDRRADIVVGVRPLARAREMPWPRRLGNRLGSWFFGSLLHLRVSDFTSGFRALSRDAVLRLHLVSDYTHTVESLIQAARLHLSVEEVPVPVIERRHGESRMTRSLVRYIGRTGGQAVRSLIHGRPLWIFGRAALAMLVLTIAFTGWFLFGYRSGGMHLPALLAAILAGIFSVGFFAAGLIADGVNSNRRLLEDALYRIKAMESALAAERRDPESARAAPPRAA